MNPGKLIATGAKKCWQTLKKGGTNLLVATTKKPDPKETHSLWSFPKWLRHPFGVVLGTMSGMQLHRIARENAPDYQKFLCEADGSHYDAVTKMIGVVAAEFLPIGIGLAVIIVIAFYTGGPLVFLYQALASRWVTPVIESHEARGEARANQAWRAWLARKEAADQAGVPFDEPPPGTVQPTG